MKTVESKGEIRNNGGWILFSIFALCLNLFLLSETINFLSSVVMIFLSLYALWRFLKKR